MSLGNISAKVGLGILYLEGNGVKKNYKKAYELFYESAQQNSDFAQWLIGTMYEKGQGVSKDYKLAKEWYLLNQELLLQHKRLYQASFRRNTNPDYPEG